MTSALMWKEVREQGLIVAALAVLGAAVLVAVGLLNPSAADQGGRQLLTDTGFLAFVMLTVTAGVVVGGTLFAGEKEAGTYAFLTLLPVPRWRIWVGKMSAGAVLVLMAAVVLFAVAAGVGVVGPPRTLLGWAVGTAALALAALSWGAVGSMYARNSLAAAGLGVAFGLFGTGLGVPLAAGFFGPTGRLLRGRLPSGIDYTIVVPLAVLFSVFALPFLISGWLYTAPDRDRKRRAVFGPGRGKRPRRIIPNPFAGVKRFAPSFRAAVWLAWRQMQLSLLVIGLLGLVSGLALLIPGAPLMAAWPGITLFLAVLVGVISWSDEQGGGSGRFWAERRTPVGRLWAAKVLVGGGITLTIVAIMLLPLLMRLSFTRIRWDEYPSYLMLAGDRPSVRQLVLESDFPSFGYLMLWPVYGFVIGHLSGLLFRKAIVAVAVAVMSAATLAAAWLPSLLAGGIHRWQLWLPPVLVLLTARTLVWSMTADRIGGSRALRRLAVGGLAVCAAVVGGLAWRVLEIPDSPERNDDIVFRQTEIPPFETNDAGREIRRAAVLLTEARSGRPLQAEDLERAPTPAGWRWNPLSQTYPGDLSRRLVSTLEHGWRPGDESFELWLGGMFENEWADVLEAAVQYKVGTVEDPTELNRNTPLRHLYGLAGADVLLLVRGLRHQADGDPEQFVRDLRTVLKLSRNVRNKSILACAQTGRQMERWAYVALTRWLEQLSGRPDLVFEAKRVIEEHADWATDDVADVRLAEQVVLRNSVVSPGEVLRKDWRYSELSGADAASAKQVMDAEADLVAFAWQIPWEQERLNRLIGLGNRQAYPREWEDWSSRAWDSMFPPRRGRDPDSIARFPTHNLPGIGWGLLVSSWALEPQYRSEEVRTVADRRAALVMLAVRQHELDRGGPPAKLAELTPQYLPAVPIDPCDGRPFRYRLSRGERMTADVVSPSPDPPPLSDDLAGQAALCGTIGLAEHFVYAALLTDRTTREIVIPPGRPILWSVGPDKIDGGGTTADGEWAGLTAQGRRLTAWVYLIP